MTSSPLLPVNWQACAPQVLRRLNVLRRHKPWIPCMLMAVILMRKIKQFKLHSNCINLSFNCSWNKRKYNYFPSLTLILWVLKIIKHLQVFKLPLNVLLECQKMASLNLYTRLFQLCSEDIGFLLIKCVQDVEIYSH
jgi:hypothetical protein